MSTLHYVRPTTRNTWLYPISLCRSPSSSPQLVTKIKLCSAHFMTNCCFIPVAHTLPLFICHIKIVQQTVQSLIIEFGNFPQGQWSSHLVTARYTPMRLVSSLLIALTSAITAQQPSRSPHISSSMSGHIQESDPTSVLIAASKGTLAFLSY